MKNKLIVLSAVVLGTLSPLKAAYPVQDTIHTQTTLTGFAKQLSEWATQHADMLELNGINDLIAQYQKQLNDIIGDPLAAANELIKAKEVLERLQKFDSIEGFEEIEKEIAGLEDVFTKLTAKPEIFGELPDQIDGVEIKREAIDYARHAVTTARVAAYEKERNTSASSLQELQDALASAQERAAKSTTETELLASLAELQGINAQIRLVQLRYDMRRGDMQAHAIAIEDRERLEAQHQRDARRAEYLKTQEQQKAQREALREAVGKYGNN